MVKLLPTSGTKARTISGWASTRDVDRVGDIVEPAGVKYRLPTPLLFGHDHRSIIGSVTSVEIKPKGIFIEATIAEGTRLADEAWQLMKQGALASFSIGFIGLKSEPIAGSYGVRWSQWELTEVSAVAVPANAAASITSVTGGA